MSKFSEIVAAVRASWPAYAAENGRPGTEVPSVRDGGNTAALIDLAVQTTLDATASDKGTDKDYVYRIVSRKIGSDEPWVQNNSWGSRTGRPYVSIGVAKGEATKRAKERWGKDREFRVERAPLNWESVDG